jgi:hypothetical protein
MLNNILINEVGYIYLCWNSYSSDWFRAIFRICGGELSNIRAAGKEKL